MASPDLPAGTTRRGEGLPEVPEAITVDHRFDADGLYALRAEAAAHARVLGVSGPQVDRLLIVVSELASNAIRHGGGRGHIRIWRDGATVMCEVTDRGTGISDLTAGTAAPEPGEPSARGLWISRQLCDSLHIDTSSAGTTVRAAIGLEMG